MEQEEDNIIQVHTHPINPALEEAFKFQEKALWILGIMLIILIIMIGLIIGGRT